MKIIVIRPAVISTFEGDTLLEYFDKYKLVDKTVVEDRVIYVFNDEE